MALNAGYFTGQKYDKCAYPEDLFESTAPYSYVMNSDRIHNCGGCLTTFGPRGGYLGSGVSSPTGDVVAAAQQNVDIDSVLSNRNVPLSKCKKGKVNPIDVTKIKTKDVPVCNDYLDGQNTRMTEPAMFYRGTAVNRFYDLNKNPQENIFYDWAINTSLEAKDNFIPNIPTPIDNQILPNGKINTSWAPFNVKIAGNANCGSSCNGIRCESDRRSRTYKNNIFNEQKYQGKGVPK